MSEPNVVLLVLDTVRKDVFDEKATGIRERSSISFEKAYAPSSWTVPSHASIFTGKLPYQHGVHAHDIDYSKLALGDTFLHSLNHRKIGVSANSFLSPEFGFDELFDQFTSLHGNEELLAGGIDTASFMQQTNATGVARYINYLSSANSKSALVPSLANAVYMKLNNATLGRSVPRIGDYGARTVLRSGLKQATSSEPFFLFANLVDAHSPHEVLREYETEVPLGWTSREYDVWEVNNKGIDQFPEYLDKFRDIYGCAVEYLDRRVSKFIDKIQSETNNETTIIVTADHGEELGLEQERTLGHKIPSAAVAHVPLEIVNPPSTWDNNRIQDVVSLLDMGKLIRGIIEEIDPEIVREVAPVERIGDPYPPNERTEFWNRGIRTTYTTDESFEWDTEGVQNQYLVSKSQEYLTAEDVTIPHSHKNLFNKNIMNVKSDAETQDSDLSDIDSRTQGRLEDLGYM